MHQATFRFGTFELDPVRRALTRDGVHVRLRPMAITLLCHLARERGRVVTKEELLDELWPDGTGSTANLTVTVAAVRKALGEIPGQNRLLITVPREGYQFVGELLDDRASAEGADLPRRIALLTPEILAGSTNPRVDATLATRIRAQIANHGTQLTGTTIFKPDESALGDGALGDLAAEAEAEALLTGTLTSNDASVELHLRLTGRDGVDRWQSRLTHAATDVHTLALRASRIVTRTLNPDPGRPPRTSPPRSSEESEAWRAYLQGRFHFASGDGSAGVQRATISFQHAVDLESTLAPAHAGLAESLILMRSYALVEPQKTTRRIREAAQAAFDCEPLLAESHLAMAQVAIILDHDWAAGREHLMSALEFGPDNPMVHSRYAAYLAWRRQFEAALDSVRRAQSLDPFSMRLTAETARIHYYAGQTSLALSILESATQRKLDFMTGWILQAWFMLGLGDGNASLRALEKLRNQLETTAMWDLFVGTAHAIEGRAEQAHDALQSLRRRREAGEHVPAQFDGLVLLVLGDFGGATECVRLSGDERYTELPIVEADPLWEPVRSWPGYAPLRRRFFGKSLTDA